MLKDKKYELLMCQLHKEATTLIDLGENALKSHEERFVPL